MEPGLLSGIEAIIDIRQFETVFFRIFVKIHLELSHVKLPGRSTRSRKWSGIVHGPPTLGHPPLSLAIHLISSVISSKYKKWENLALDA